MPPELASYIGIDPSPTKTGLARITPDGLETKLLTTKLRGVERLRFYRDELKKFLELSGQIVGVCIEGPSLGSINRADDLGQLRGVLEVCAMDFCTDIVVVAPTSLKKYLAGHGGAKKDAMIRAAQKQWDVLLSEDEADAAGLAAIARALHDSSWLTRRAEYEVIDGIKRGKVKLRISSRCRDNI
jgi:Holliday junction resolvasome RuvABC endonuclease subunit